jgi:cytochrome c oxidase assembly factor CtaG
MILALWLRRQQLVAQALAIAFDHRTHLSKMVSTPLASSMCWCNRSRLAGAIMRSPTTAAGSVFFLMLAATWLDQQERETFTKAFRRCYFREWPDQRGAAVVGVLLAG